ncbi:type III pantothenate kinase [Solemya velesiana gill symbiont]|uniref:Type III pantothenate kinase n=1 Tax=Solemya velesiana gill symbiont TaxID=1918948 RepID=A0A1T2KP34_9GAMM|nr:type III pantothenate kinase [Solemya velesiana gill symbiont]OOZ34617.1 hypothetical protein BOW51_12010 [Solemya velesiana gill symbiont]
MNQPDNTVPTVLLIDIGNTNLKWSWLDNRKLSSADSAPHESDAFAKIAANCWGDADTPDRVVVANVAGREIEQHLSDWSQNVWGVTPEIVTTSAQALGVVNAYENPAQLGVDRWLTLVAVHGRYPGAACIVDCGTAITIDVIDAHGVHKGGLILPGFELMRRSLLERTNIPRVDVACGKQLLAKDTATAVAAAGIHAAAALIERVIAKTAQELGARLTLILTGSGSRKLLEVLESTGTVIPDLVMVGLAMIATDGEYPK